MLRGVWRSLIIALLTGVIGLTAQAVYVTWFCSRHGAWIRAHSGRDVIMLNHQYGVPRATDAVFACETIHRMGPISFHHDLVYYCAPAAIDLNAVASQIGGTCVVEQNRAGVSRYCDEHADF
jgi:hypothetical protein